MTRTEAALQELAAPVRRLNALAWGLVALAAGLTALAAGAWTLRLGDAPPALVVAATWVAAAAAIGVVLRRARAARRALALPAVAARVEQLLAGRRGVFQALVEAAAPGTSAGLRSLADAAAEGHLRAEGPARLGGWMAATRRFAAGAAAASLLALAGLALARPAEGQARLLWAPLAALDLARGAVSLRAEPAIVPARGEVVLHLGAPGRREALLWARAPGEAWVREAVALDEAGEARVVVTEITDDRHFLLTAGGRTSDTVTVRVRRPLFLGGLRVVARYPAYLGLEDEPVPATGDLVLVPAGTELVTSGEASAPLAAAEWLHPDRPAALAVTGSGFSGRFRPAASGTWELALAGGDGSRLAGDPVRLAVELVPDRPPVVEIPIPGRDTLAPLDLRVPIVVDAADDHAIRRAAVVVEAPGRPPQTLALPVPEGGADRLLETIVLDLAGLGLAPGDTVAYYAFASDRSPTGQAGRSRTYRIVVPTPSEQRDARRDATRSAEAQLDSLAAQARRLERQTEDLARQRLRGQEGGRTEGAMGFEEARRAEAVARDQEDLTRQAEALRETLEAMQRAIEEGAAPDSALARRLEEIRAQLDRALSPELRARLQELQRAVQRLDAEATREALRELAETQQVLREALERSLELFRRAALEAELGNLAEDARDLAEQQAAWNAEVARGDSAALADREETMAARADSVAGGLDQVAREVTEEEVREALEAAAEQARQAAGSMREAAGAAREGRRQEARRHGERAEQDLARAGETAAEQRAEQQDGWRREVLEALDRAMAETARLARQQLAVAGAIRDGRMTGPARTDLGLLEESTRKLMDQMTALSGRNALVPPQIAVALAVARRQMGQAREVLSTAAPNLREAGGLAGEAVDALTVAAYAMVRARDDVAGASSGSGLAEAMERMTSMAQRQGQLSQQAGQLLPMAGSASLQLQLQSMAAQQRQLAQELERMRAEGQIPGARAMGEEARDLARALEAGRLDRETVARQEQLFRRMLDAGRTLEGEEQDERQQRRSTPAAAGNVQLPAGLQRPVGGATVLFPSWETLQRLSPETRRLVTEYFRRLAGTGAR